MPGSSSTSDRLGTVGDTGEAALIARVRARAAAPASWVTVGIGDDAAVMEPPRGELDVITTDALVEDVHFRRAWTDPHSIGRKAVAVNLSDLAAMGATPRVILLSLILPPGLPLADFDAIIDGVAAETEAAGASLVGGNIARSPGPLVLSLTATGRVGRRRVMTRGGGRAGDELYVTGTIGGAAAGLAILQGGADRAAWDPTTTACVSRLERPEARVRCGRVVAASRSAHACMDLSDGLADAVRQIARASGTGAVLDAGALPIAPGAAVWLGHDGSESGLAQMVVAGGEDYELLFAVPPKRRRRFLQTFRLCRPVPVTLVGRLTKEPGEFLVVEGLPHAFNSGFRHFQA